MFKWRNVAIGFGLFAVFAVIAMTTDVAWAGLVAAILVLAWSLLRRAGHSAGFASFGGSEYHIDCLPGEDDTPYPVQYHQHHCQKGYHVPGI